MTIAFAIEYIPRRMQELGIGNQYYLRFRHLVLSVSETLELDADNQWFLLVEDVEDLSIESDFARYDLSDEGLNEQGYEHSGKLKLQNHAPQNRHVRFIQIIPIE